MEVNDWTLLIGAALEDPVYVLAGVLAAAAELAERELAWVLAGLAVA